EQISLRERDFLRSLHSSGSLESLLWSGYCAARLPCQCPSSTCSPRLVLLGDRSASSSFRGVVDGFAFEWRHKHGRLAHLARLLIRVGEADDLFFFVWFAKERDGHRQALGAEAHRNDDGRKAD